MGKKALVTGVAGMDGSHMVDLLLSKGYEVWGVSRNPPSLGGNISHLSSDVGVFAADIREFSAIRRAIQETRPDEIYNFASQSSVSESWKDPTTTHETNASGVLNILESIREIDRNIKFFQPSSSEMYGDGQDHKMQNEITPFWPKNPYASSKLYAHWITKNYRDAYGIFCCCGILFNHESERRGKNFVSRKITSEVAKIHLGMSQGFSLGNINTKRDWGYAKDYVDAMWRMLQQNRNSFHAGKNGDFVVATGKTRSIKSFLKESFSVIGIDEWEKYVNYDDELSRPDDTPALCGDSTKIRKKLGWTPTTSFEDMVRRMVENDISILGEKDGV
jgi:GDPmannose 4,6-dehydratase